MVDHTEIMGELIEMGINTNPVLPFTACILDPCKQILVTSCNAMHISPLYSAEGLALHMLAGNFHSDDNQHLTLITTCEPDNGSLLAIYWASLQGIRISEIVYGATRDDIKASWPDDPGLPFSDYLGHFPAAFRNSLKLTGPILQPECREIFQEGHDMEKQGSYPVLSMDIDQFWMPGDWLMDD
ncbi:hypothetical protein [Endozoicomonas sp. Mp262]|uniref:hypothetical protein n=1 Tax=Endozoicomonas sp. Mp262 TaxID=2919499 RepID=UPI0021D92AD9